MGARRCGTREEKFHICNTIALYWQEKPTYVWMKRKRSTIPEKKLWSALALRWRNALNHNKDNNGLKFEYTKFLLCPYRHRKSFRYSVKIGLWQIFQLSLSTSLFIFWFSSSFRKGLNVTVYKRYGFFSVLAAIIRENFDKRPWIKNGGGFAVLSAIWPCGTKGEWRVSPSFWRRANARHVSF